MDIDFQAYGSEVVLLGLVRSQDDVNNAIKTVRGVKCVSTVRSFLVPSR